MNTIVLQESNALGQRVKAFTIEANVDGAWNEVARGTTIGHKRIMRFKPVTAAQLRINILDARACPVISSVGVFNATSMPR
jgi:alpha-L-fucosidase